MNNNETNHEASRRERIEEIIKHLQESVEILEDTIHGDPQRRIPGALSDIASIKEELSILYSERETLKQQAALNQKFEDFMKYWENKESLIKGIAIGLGSTTLLSLLSLVATVFGIGG